MKIEPIIYNFDRKEMEVRKVMCSSRSYKVLSEAHPIKKREGSRTKQGDSDSVKDEYYLDPNHTHFILVDDRNSEQSRAEIDLRLRLENKIDTLWENCASIFSHIP